MRPKVIVFVVFTALAARGAAQVPYARVNYVNLLSERAVSDRTVYCYVYEPKNLYISISKKDRTLFVFERRCTGITLIAAYPVCLGAGSGNKEQKGDCRTPESPDNQPFTISEIVDASSWRHDFGDGRGAIVAYGNWFMRLKGDFAGSGIGIHGSTGNRYSVPGRASEGCIRLRDEDLQHLKENYAFVGMEVHIGGEF